MGYIRAEDVLPDELVRILQEYAEGQMIYVPKKGQGQDGERCLGQRKACYKEIQ